MANDNRQVNSYSGFGFDFGLQIQIKFRVRVLVYKMEIGGSYGEGYTIRPASNFALTRTHFLQDTRRDTAIQTSIECHDLHNKIKLYT